MISNEQNQDPIIDEWLLTFADREAVSQFEGNQLVALTTLSLRHRPTDFPAEVIDRWKRLIEMCRIMANQSDAALVAQEVRKGTSWQQIAERVSLSDAEQAKEWQQKLLNPNP
ncbi:hypothetical protein [Amycolatopsis suaedae]|uniref:Uncharacterized protein n=1 Tax=Amycolatopsis suaedae TaxID=2510978 RepID=A0A4Q7J332_9PSEU|nr:hypothetical protein [Amycolatopsis suaedae]RZQ61006.1 hypothetical protein EWH70_26375 [Amycolatopsis suaedae]